MPTLSQITAKINQFLANFQQHRHTGTDSPKVSYLDLTNVPAPTIPQTYYTGVVTSNAAGTPFPTGWTVVNGSTGEYTITHNLGTTDYTVSALAHASLFCQLASKGANSFLLIWWASQSTTQNCDFDFQVFT